MITYESQFIRLQYCTKIYKEPQTMFSIKVQICIRTSVTVLIEYGQGSIMSELEGLEK